MFLTRSKSAPTTCTAAKKSITSFGIEPDEVEPVYTTLPGWPGDLTGIRTLEEVPPTLLDYVAFIEEAVGVPVTVLSVGPDREQTLTLKAAQPVG